MSQRQSTSYSYGLPRGKIWLDRTDHEEQALKEADASQCDIDDLTWKCQDEVAYIEYKYNNLKKQHLLKRDAALRKIPSFWYHVFLNHPTISGLIKDEESMALTFMNSLEVEDLPQGEIGFKITFHFLENPYLGNHELIKTVSVENGVLHCESTDIDWKASAKSLRLSEGGFFGWFIGAEGAPGDQKRVSIAIAEDLWNSPLKYYSSPTIEIWDEDSAGVVADDTDEPEKSEHDPNTLEQTIAESASMTDHFVAENSIESSDTSGDSLTEPTVEEPRKNSLC